MNEGVEADGQAMRAGERRHEGGLSADAAITFIGRLHTPFRERHDCPRQGRQDGPPCRVELFDPWHEALRGIERYPVVELLYWLDRARRDLLLQNPGRDGRLVGTFALRSPVRPNPIGTALVRVDAVERDGLLVRGLDCLDGTPLLDIKPDRCRYSPRAAPKS